MKLTYKVDMDEILDNFKNWPDRVANLRYFPLTAEKASA